MTYQLNAPLLDACVLGIVAHEDSYGYTLTQKVRELVDISESTLYPVLRRLQKQQFLETYDKPFQGRNRRYYRITEAGNQQLAYFRTEWLEYKDKIDELLNASNIEKNSGEETQKEGEE
ncbi:MAG: PadR family transcriptional regulator [Eubacterium sp.]|nr:PadR family transcriptional regulator [Eubacterium sp.]